MRYELFFSTETWLLQRLGSHSVICATFQSLCEVESACKPDVPCLHGDGDLPSSSVSLRILRREEGTLKAEKRGSGITWCVTLSNSLPHQHQKVDYRVYCRTCLSRLRLLQLRYFGINAGLRHGNGIFVLDKSCLTGPRACLRNT